MRVARPSTDVAPDPLESKGVGAESPASRRERLHTTRTGHLPRRRHRMLFIGRIFSAIGSLFSGIMGALRALIPGGRRRR